MKLCFLNYVSISTCFKNKYNDIPKIRIGTQPKDCFDTPSLYVAIVALRFKPPINLVGKTSAVMTHTNSIQ